MRQVFQENEFLGVCFHSATALLEQEKMFTEVNGIIIWDLSLLLKLNLKYEAILCTLNHKMSFLRMRNG